MVKMTKSVIPPIPYFSARANRLNELFIRPALMSQLFEKKIKIREDKKRPINFSYFLVRANRLNELFIKASSYEPTLRKKDEW
ncbi:hypothetical protein AB6884_02400 [Carnobacterium maltaromaticum]|uniref:hypothetical protein n=1 Tax=Carnobacterium maltaromaticum TaxID=2751 RepID=UPI0039BE046C